MYEYSILWRPIFELSEFSFNRKSILDLIYICILCRLFLRDINYTSFVLLTISLSFFSYKCASKLIYSLSSSTNSFLNTCKYIYFHIFKIFQNYKFRVHMIDSHPQWTHTNNICITYQWFSTIKKKWMYTYIFTYRYRNNFSDLDI